MVSRRLGSVARGVHYFIRWYEKGERKRCGERRKAGDFLTVSYDVIPHQPLDFSESQPGQSTRSNQLDQIDDTHTSYVAIQHTRQQLKNTNKITCSGSVLSRNRLPTLGDRAFLSVQATMSDESENLVEIITEDGGVTKEVLQSGAGTSPAPLEKAYGSYYVVACV